MEHKVGVSSDPQTHPAVPLPRLLCYLRARLRPLTVVLVRPIYLACRSPSAMPDVLLQEESRSEFDQNNFTEFSRTSVARGTVDDHEEPVCLFGETRVETLVLL